MLLWPAGTNRGGHVNALLVYPEIPETFWSFKHALRMIRKRAGSPALGLLTVAGMLPDDWDLALVDLNIAELSEQDLEWADVALVSAMVIQRDSAHAAIRLCKEHGLKVIAGGPLFSSEHEKFEEVDHFVLGEAEPSLPALLADLENGRGRRIYAQPGHPDLTDTPVPQWDLVDSRSYSSRNIQYSRGCPHNCDFCSVTQLFGHKSRTKSAEQIIAELDSLYDLGWRGTVGFVDDNLIGNKRKLRVTINLADDDELMSLMVQAGFDTVFVGIESLNDASLSECNKKQNENRDMLEDVRKIQRAGLVVQGGFIVGFDHDSADVFERLAAFIQQSGIATAMVGMLQAPAGTRLYERLRSEGRIQREMSGDNVDGTTNIVPVMGMERLRKGYRETLAELYSPRNYYARLRTLLREYRPHPVKASLHGWHILAFFRSVYFLSIVGEERFRYPGLLLWTIFRNPRAFPTAVVLAISGYHLRMCFGSWSATS
jgi:radical SAM superfamily enzyme YgiQ (UPF0313 family)